MEPIKVAKIIKILNAIDALGLGFLLIIAFAMQIILHELPCPLCILQRIGILAIAFGFLLNVQFNIRPGHYTLSLLAALLTASMSIRQIFLHVIPGDPGYGLPVFGVHLYTWVFLLCVGIIIYIAVILSIFPQYSLVQTNKLKSRSLQTLTHLAFTVVFLLTIFNGVSTYLECGFKPCPENPSKYEIQLVETHPSHT
ncbi:MAG: disulfide bond formation protein B [Rickettsiella sp.]|nr:disulfide bond formation protein B [Rickettsiella sp.]